MTAEIELLRDVTFGYTRTGRARHIYKRTLNSLCGRDVTKASVSPHLDGKHYLTCIICAGHHIRLLELAELKRLKGK